MIYRKFYTSVINYFKKHVNNFLIQYTLHYFFFIQLIFYSYIKKINIIYLIYNSDMLRNTKII